MRTEDCHCIPTLTSDATDDVFRAWARSRDATATIAVDRALLDPQLLGAAPLALSLLLKHLGVHLAWRIS
jgi:hypothetical protein